METVCFSILVFSVKEIQPFVVFFSCQFMVLLSECFYNCVLGICQTCCRYFCLILLATHQLSVLPWTFSMESPLQTITVV